jgi:SPP1 family phage portal protein
MPNKEEVAKILQFLPEMVDGKQQYGDAEYLTWDRTPESIKSEYEILKDIIYSQTYTPDLSFNNVKGIGTNLSGIVFKFMFMDAMLKSTTKREILSEGLERRVNLLREMLKKTDAKISQTAIADPRFDELEISFDFEDIMPENISETLENISKATGGQTIISRRRAIELNPMVIDPEEEMKQIEKEEENSAVKADSFLPVEPITTKNTSIIAPVK